MGIKRRRFPWPRRQAALAHPSVSHRRRRLLAEELERRFALAAVPSAVVNGPAVASLIGEEIPLVVTFDNTSSNPADIGYSPFVDIVMPKMGDAPPDPENGIEFKTGSASYDGLALQTTVLEFDASGQATHPFAKNPDGSPVIVTGTPGDQLVVVQLPFGSYGPEQPAAEIHFTGVVSDLAQPSHSYAVTATGGFRYQTDASGNPTIDVADFGTTTTDPIQPQLFRVSKTSGAPESETATGPNFAHTYTVSMAVAPGQTVTDLLLEDVLPGSVQFVSVGTVTGNGSSTITPVSTPSTTVPGGTLSRRFDQVVGTGSDSDVQMTFAFYVPQKDAGGTDVIPLGTGGTAVVTNTASASATWTSANPNFPTPQTISSDPSDPDASATLTARTVALQKTYANLTNPGSARAGDTIEYTLRFQVSDFFALDDLVLTDVLSDGQEFDTTFTPTISFSQQSESVSGSFDLANYSTTLEANGTQTVVFNVSNELSTQGLSTAPQVLGAGVPPGGTGDPATLPDAMPSGPGTTGTIRFQAKILNKYRVTPRPNADVVQGDRMSDVADLSSDVLDYATLTNVVDTAGDGSSRSFTLVSGNAVKTLYAINGAAPTPDQRVTAGDAVTFRLTYTLPFSSIKDYQISDYLPLPIFAAQDLTFAGGGASAAAPAAGQWSFGPTDTFSQAPISGPNPGTATANVAANSITWNFGTFADTSDRSGKTDILFTVTASNKPFGDGLLLTNQAQQSERNETDDLITSNTALAQVTMSEPELRITKGVVSTSNPNGIYREAGGIFPGSPPLPAGVSFSGPGQPGNFTGTITSGPPDGIATTPIDATLENVLGNDLVKFTIIVENTGSGPNGAFDVAIKDTIDSRYQIPTSGAGLNLQVTDGAGTSLAYVGDLFSGGIILTDKAQAIAADNASNYPSQAYTNANPPPNQGAGFGSWAVYPQQSSVFVGSTALGPHTFGVTAIGQSPSTLVRDFLAPLSVGETFSASIAGTAFTTGLMGTSFGVGGGSTSSSVLDVFVENGTGNWMVARGASDPGTATSIPFVADTPLEVRVTRVSNTDVLVALSQTGTAAWSGTLTLTDAALSDVQFFSSGTGAQGPSTNLGFDNLQISGAATQGALDPGKSPGGVVVNTGKNIAVITYDLQIKPDVVPLADIKNTATLTNYAATEGGPNFLPPAGISDDTFVTIQSPQIDKILVGTSIVDAYNDNTQAVIGEKVFYQLRIDVPRGVTPNAVVTDTLTDALGLVNVTGVTLDPGVTISKTPNSPGTNPGNNPILSSSVSTGNQATFDLGDITNTNTDNQLHGLTIDFEAVVLNVRNVPSTLFQPVNRAELAWTDHSTPQVHYSLPEVRAPAVWIIEPKVTVAKSVSPTTAQANDTATFTIVVSGAANRPIAHDVSLSDFLPAGVTYVPGTLAHTAGVAPATLTTSGGGTAFAATWTKLNAGETSTLTFQTTVNADVTSGQAITNTVPIEWTSLPGNPGQITPFYATAYERTGSGSTTQGQLNNYKTSDSATITVAKPTVTKSLVSTSIAPTSTVNAANSNTQAVIGELATYDVTVTIPQGRTPAAELIDQMGPGLAFVQQISAINNSPSVLTVPGLNNAPVLTSLGTVATWNLGDIVNTDTNSATAETITFRIETVVLNVNSNISGVTLNNRAQLYWNHRAAQSNKAQNKQVTIIEPKLKTTKTASVGSGGVRGNPGDPVTYTIVIEQDPASQTDAFDATLTDVLPVEIAAPVLASVVDTAGVVTAANFQLAGGTLSTTTPFDFEKNPSGRTITLTVTGTLQGPFTANQQIVNTDYVRWTSLNGSPGQITPNNPNAYERTGSNATNQGQLNNYVASGTATVTAQTADLAVTKTVDHPTPNVGDTITFTVEVSNAGPDAATGVELTDTFPTAGLQIVGTPTVTQGTYDQATGVWDIGTVLVGGANKQTLTIQALVLAPAVNTIPAAQTNTAEITNATEPDPNPANNRDDATETPKYADLGIKKTTSNPTPNVGETVTYTVSLFNLGTSEATGVKVTDTFPANITYLGYSTASGTFDPATGIWDVGTVPLSATVLNPLELEIQVRAENATTAFNVVTITHSDVWDPNNRNNTAKTPTTGLEADLILSKTAGNPSPNVGDPVNYTITVENAGPSLAQAVVVTDKIPTGTTFVSASNGGTYNPATREVTWSLGNNFPLGHTELTVQATVDTPASGAIAPIVNTATVSSTTPDPNPPNNTDTETLTPLQTDLAVFKVVSNPTPNVGDTIQFAIGAANFGPNDATNVVVTDVIPVGVTYVGLTSGIGTNPTHGTANYDAPTRTLTWTIGALNTSDFPILEFDATVDAPSPAGIPPSVTNTATISGTEYDPDPTNNTDSVDETPQYADLEVTKQVGQPTPNVGDTITYTITVTNTRGHTATGVTLLDTLRTLSGLQITGTPQTNLGTFDQATGIWTIGTLNVGFAATLSIEAKVLAPASGNPQPQTNTASIATVDQYDPVPGNNSATATETPQYADLTVTKIVSNPAPNVGANVTFTIEVENLGADQATNVSIDDFLPAGLTFISASSQAYDPGTGVWQVGTVDIGTANKKTLKITAAVAASGSFTNEAEVSTSSPPDQYDPDKLNNKGSATVTTREADLVVTKTVDKPTPNVGDLITFTVTVRNDGPDIANNVEVTDSFPTTGLQLVGATPSQGSFDTNTGIWTIGTIDVGMTNEQNLQIQARVLPPPINPDPRIPSPQTNVASVTKVDEHDPNPGNETGQVTETPQYADLAISKLTSNVQPNVGDQFTYTVTLENLGTATATNVEVTEAFPNNISIVSITPTNTHTTTRFNQTATGGVWSVPSIAPGSSEILVIIAKATNASVAFNTVEITHSDVWDPNRSNNSARTPTDPQSADLVVTKWVDNARPEVNSTVTFTVTLENLGPTAAHNVTVADPQPAGLVFQTVTPSVGTYVGGVWTLGTVAANATESLTITALVSAPASGTGPVSSATNTATANSTTVDPNPGNNTDTSTVSPLQADLAVSKTASSLTPQIGTEFTYTIQVSNRGLDTASLVTVNDQLPADLVYVSHTATTGAYDPGTGVWTVGTVTTADRPELEILVRVNTGNSGGIITNTATVGSGTWDPDESNNTSTVDVDVPPRGVIVGTDIGCETGPFVRVIDPDTGANRITPFFAYEPEFRGGVRVYGADVTGDGVPEIITAPGPGRPGEIKVFSETGAPLPAYSFFPFGPSYAGGIEIAAGPVTAAGAIEIVAGQSRGGTVRVFEVTPAAAHPVATSPIRQFTPFGTGYLGGVSVETADVGTFSGSTRTLPDPDGIMELFVGSGSGIQATVKGYNGQPSTPALFNSFAAIGPGYTGGVSVARLPSTTPGSVDRILASAGVGGNTLVETYSGVGSSREAFFQAYGNDRAQVFSAAIDDNQIFNVQGLVGTLDGVQKSLSPSGTGASILPQSTVSYPPLRVAILRS